MKKKSDVFRFLTRSWEDSKNKDDRPFEVRAQGAVERMNKACREYKGEPPCP